MNYYLTHWSLTRRKVFANCARRFAISYIKNNSAQFPHKRRNKWRSPWDLMIQSTREVFFQWLSDLHKNTIWTNKTIYSNIRFKIITNLYTFNATKGADFERLRNQLTNQGYLRFKKLLRQDLIRRIIGGKIKEWSFHKRINPVKFGHLEVYCSPDIVFKLGKKWNLVRLNFQSERNQPYHDLELCTMLLWSRGNQYLPNLDNKFNVFGIYYHMGKWQQKHISPTQQLLQETKQLLEKDVHNMNLLLSDFNLTGDYDSLPLATSKRYCKRCPYKKKCPVNSN